MIIIDTETPKEVLVLKKVNSGEEITRSELESLGIWNDYHINRVLEAGQAEVRRQVAKAVCSPGIIEVEADGKEA